MKIKLTEEDPMKHHSKEYPMEIGAQKFEPVKIEQEKDKMLVIAQMQAQQEYDRIMEVVAVLKKQADDIKRRMEITQLVHAAKFQFKVVPGKAYYLIKDHRKKITILSPMGPYDWSSSIPEEYEYLAKVLCLGDFTWQEIVPLE